ncbi:MAG: hypothetical protein WBL93_00535 [Lutisporaceae bacterium]
MITLKTGQLIKHNNEGSKQDEYVMRLLTTKELGAVVNLQEYVYDQLPNKQVLYVDTYKEMMEDMKQGAQIIGVYNNSEDLIAYRYVGFPGESDKNLGIDVKLPAKELCRVAHLETTVVRPDYRGNSLQSLTLQQAVPLIKSLGYKHLLCTVSPQNFFSLFNVMRNGLKVKALKKKYGSDQDGKDGLWRFILHRDMEPNTLFKPNQFINTKLNNIDEQLKLINDGFVGFWLDKDNKELNYIQFNDSLAY